MSSICDMQAERARPRRKVFEPTLMRVGGDTAKAHLLDLSATGALVHAAQPPAAGAHVLIGCGGEMRPARVVWVRERRFGVAFTAPLTDERVNAAITDRQAAVAAAAARIGAIAR